MNSRFQNLMRAATQLTRAGRLGDATRAIQRALRGARPGAVAPQAANADAGGTLDGARELAQATLPQLVEPTPIASASTVLEAALVVDAAVHVESQLEPSVAPLPTSRAEPIDVAVIDVEVIDEPATALGEGEFVSASHRHASQNHNYKLYLPPNRAGRRLPLVVMLHGCTQDPDDFAAGTGMNAVAREEGFFVLYPAQSRLANPSGCWNWFKHNDQQRDSGEPAAIAALTQVAMQQHDIDPRRVYIAGLSAGGAMAAIVAKAYPEIFAAVGVHSGLPCGAASSAMEAFIVMRNGEANRIGAARGACEKNARQSKPIPTIVFHGDKDKTVHPRNGEQVIAAVTGDTADAKVEQGVSSLGRHYTRSTHHDDDGNALAEHWLVHGAGHAWSGGNSQGSYTDANGPDATRAMLQFFFARPLGTSH